MFRKNTFRMGARVILGFEALFARALNLGFICNFPAYYLS